MCGPIEGSCSPTPGQSYIRAGSCNEAQMLIIDFGAPAGLLLADPMGSTKHECNDILPPGRPVVSKEITDLLYAPGKCQPSGGGGRSNTEDRFLPHA